MIIYRARFNFLKEEFEYWLIAGYSLRIVLLIKHTIIVVVVLRYVQINHNYNYVFIEKYNFVMQTHDEINYKVLCI